MYIFFVHLVKDLINISQINFQSTEFQRLYVKHNKSLKVTNAVKSSQALGEVSIFDSSLMIFLDVWGLQKGWDVVFEKESSVGYEDPHKQAY